MQQVASMHQIWRMTWPILLYNVLEMTVGIADLVMVRSFGTPATAAIAVSRQVAILVEAGAIGITGGVTSLVSQATGARRSGRVRRLTVQSLYLALACGLLSGCLGLSLTRSVLGWLRVSDATLGPATGYLMVYFAGLTFSWCTLTATAILRGRGDVTTPLGIAVVMNLLNILFNYFFIFGAGPLPSWQVPGAAAGTVAARACAAAIYLVVLFRGMSSLGRARRFTRKSGRASLLPHPRTMFHIASLGVPLGCASLVRTGARLFYLGVVGASGAMALQAAVGVGMQFRMLGVLPALAFQVAINSLVGQAIGRRDADQARQIGRRALSLLAVLMLAVTLALVVLSDFLARLVFASAADAEVGGQVLRWFAVAQFFSALSIGAQGILMGRGDTRPPLRYMIFSQWLVMVPLAMAAARIQWVPHGLLLVWTVAPALALVLMQLRVRRHIEMDGLG